MYIFTNFKISQASPRKSWLKPKMYEKLDVARPQSFCSRFVGPWHCILSSAKDLTNQRDLQKYINQSNRFMFIFISLCFDFAVEHLWIKWWTGKFEKSDIRYFITIKPLLFRGKREFLYRNLANKINVRMYRLYES